MAIVLLLLPLLFPPLSVYGNGSLSKWSSLTPEFDRVTGMLEMSEGSSPAFRKKLADSLYAMAFADGGCKVSRWRALYYNAIINNEANNVRAATVMIRKASAMVDKSRYYYDYRRIERSRALIENTSIEGMYRLYKAQYRDMEYFQQVGDLKTAANCRLVMGKILLDFDEPYQAMYKYKEAKEIYHALGMEAREDQMDMNLALCSIKLGDIKRALDVLKMLERGRVAAADTIFRLGVLLNISYSYSRLGKSCPDEYFLRMKELSEASANGYYRNMCNVNIGAWLIRRKRYHEAARVLYEAKCHAEAQGLAQLVSHCYRGLADCFWGIGAADSASAYYNRHVVVEDSLQICGQKAMIMKQEGLNQIRRFEQTVQLEKERLHLHYLKITALFVIAIVILAAMALFHRYRHKRTAIMFENEQLKSEKQRLELEAQARKLAASTMAMEDKNTALRQIRSQIEMARSNKEISPGIALQINSRLKVHLGQDTTWQSFKETFEKVYPGFFLNIKTEYPSLTEYDIRLSTFIIAGLDNKQISAVLNIQPDSLKKSRSRLRHKLGLGAGADLAEFLRKLNG